MYRPDKQREIKEKHWRGLVERAKRQRPAFDPDAWKREVYDIFALILNKHPPRRDLEKRQWWMDFRELLELAKEGAAMVELTGIGRFEAAERATPKAR